MTRLSVLRLGIAFSLLVGAIGCNDDDNDVTGSRGSLVSLDVDAPSFAQSGVEFGIQVNAANVGFSNIRNGRVTVTFETPLSPRSVDASAGTTATISGSSITWDLGTLDSNTRSHIDVRALGTLSPGESSRSARVRAELTAQGISVGDAVADDFVTITP
jgi:hypothetical protein